MSSLRGADIFGRLGVRPVANREERRPVGADAAVEEGAVVDACPQPTRMPQRATTRVEAARACFRERNE
jgi:hypothetical protein